MRKLGRRRLWMVPKYHAVIDVEANVEQAQEANEIQNGLENYNVDLNNFGDD